MRYELCSLDQRTNDPRHTANVPIVQADTDLIIANEYTTAIQQQKIRLGSIDKKISPKYITDK